MTTVVVLADVPDENVLPALHPSPLSSSQAVSLYRAMLADVCEMVQHGEADLLVNYPSPERVAEDVDPEAALRDVLEDELPESESVRYEVQVGETYAGRVGNTLTHLLDVEGERTVGIVDPATPLLGREHIGTVAMKLRASDVVLGPTTGGRLYFAGFCEPVDFDGAFSTPAVETMTARALEAGLSVDYLPPLPLVASPADLATVVTLVRARRAAGRIVPRRTAALLEEWELQVVAGGESRPTVSTGSDKS